MKQDAYSLAAKWILESNHVVIFSGAGISVESGIPPFRGENGLWNKYNPVFLDTNYFKAHPKKSWILIKEIFYDFFNAAEYNEIVSAVISRESVNRCFYLGCMVYSGYNQGAN
ncbi:unnamed protein product [marine sediment metagenome]|uniref:Deacetylase sirtuin-type domain-containing protein n=1 Tax=marine sediment metagenome TaxID=412755 RepID=X1PCZ6_9ZZZZ